MTMRDDTRLAKFQTHDGARLPSAMVSFCAPQGKLDTRRVRTLYSLAGIQPPLQDATLLTSLLDNAHLLIAFEKHGGTHVFSAVTPAARSPARKRSPARSRLPTKSPRRRTALKAGADSPSATVPVTPAT